MTQFLPQIIMVICIIIYAGIYLVGIKRGTVKPILATWLFLSLATLLSIVTDFKETGVHGLLANAFNIADTFAVLVIFIVVLFRTDTRRTFNQFEKWCLGLVVFIFIAWLLSGANIVAHLSIQAILVLAYLPTLVHLWKAIKNTEALGTWSFDCLASLFGLYEPLRTGQLLPTVYGVRSVVSTLLVIILILRIKYKNHKLAKMV